MKMVANQVERRMNEAMMFVPAQIVLELHKEKLVELDYFKNKTMRECG